ncbi:MAG: transcription termination factor Rho [Verrucomicrobiota bacterium]
MSQSQSTEEAQPSDDPAAAVETEPQKPEPSDRLKEEKPDSNPETEPASADSRSAEEEPEAETEPNASEPLSSEAGPRLEGASEKNETSSGETAVDPAPETDGEESQSDADSKEATRKDEGLSENRGEKRRDQGGQGKKKEGAPPEGQKDNREGDGPPKKTRKQRYLERKEKERAREAAALESAPPMESEGIVEISNKGFGFLREKKRGFQQSPKDVFITPEVVRNFALRDGLMVKCISKQGVRGPQLVELLEINGREPNDYLNLPYFEELTAINPDKKLTLETEPTRQTTRVIDLMAPIGRGQRGLIVAPPITGNTTLLHHIAEGIQENYDEEMHLMVLLVDERPEEVTDFERSFPDVEVFSSSNDSDAKDHTRMALLAIERAKRLVEAGEHVFILMDSITRLARAFDSQMRGGGKRGTASGGLLVGALEVPRRIFAAARNTREAGSMTIIATALIQTNSKADEAIFQEFKGTGNMELVLDRQIAQNYVYPAVDINRSGTRREELLLPPHMLEKIYVIRRGLSGYKPLDAMEWLLRCMERYPSNAQMLMDIKTTALS